MRDWAIYSDRVQRASAVDRRPPVPVMRPGRDTAPASDAAPQDPDSFGGFVRNMLAGIMLPGGDRRQPDRVPAQINLMLQQVWIAAEEMAADDDGPPPASDAAIDSLLEVVIGENTARVADDDCVVCRDAFKIGQSARELPCRHLFHSDCIVPWLKTRNTCPICRHELPTDGDLFDGVHDDENADGNVQPGRQWDRRERSPASHDDDDDDEERHEASDSMPSLCSSSDVDMYTDDYDNDDLVDDDDDEDDEDDDDDDEEDDDDEDYDDSDEYCSSCGAANETHEARRDDEPRRHVVAARGDVDHQQRRPSNHHPTGTVRLHARLRAMQGRVRRAEDRAALLEGDFRILHTMSAGELRSLERQQVRALRRTRQALESALASQAPLCVLCRRLPIQVAFRPCNCACVCHECADSQRTVHCPVCNANVLGRAEFRFPYARGRPAPRGRHGHPRSG